MGFLIILLSFLIFMFMVVKSVRKKSTKNDLDLIPGPRRLPLIGNLHLLAGNNSPLHQVFKDIATRYGPILRLQLGEIPYIIVSSVKVAEQVLKTHDQIFANRPDLGCLAKAVTYDFMDIGLSPYGEYWRYLRKICTLELLSIKRVKSFRPIREEENMNLCKCIASKEGSPANLSEQVYLSSFNITTRAAVGNKTEDQETITSALKEVMKMQSGFNLADLYPSVKFLSLISGAKAKTDRLFQQTDRVFDIVINQHRVANINRTNNDATERSEDLADVLLKYQEDGSEMPLTNNNIKAVLLDMFTAGGETSATAVDWAMSELIRNPKVLKRAQEEIRKVFDDKGYVDESKFDELKYLKLVIKETLRLHPPIPLLIPRESSQACEVNGYKLPAKTRVLINAWALGRDPKYWKDADKFTPERFLDNSIDYKGNNFEYIPFGGGRRICPGMSFGMANVEFSLAMLLYHFDWGMPNGIKNEDLDMADDFGFSAKRKQDLLLIATVKRPLQLVK